MYKRLRIYYLYTAAPFILLLIAAGVYHKAIIKTITSNPHPQINYIIFAITLLGGVLILMSVKRLMQEVKNLAEFIDARRANMEPEQLQEMALNCEADIAYVLRMVAASSGRAISHQEQIALENELHKASARLGSRNALPQFLGGLLVGMGLLGTFIGLLATLDDIAILISSFGSLDMKTADPIQVFSLMVQRMEAPMHSMGIAFSASMYGLLGSIIIGFMMVSLKRCMSEINSILGSEVAQHIEFALALDGFSYSKSGIRSSTKRAEAKILPREDISTAPIAKPVYGGADAPVWLADERRASEEVADEDKQVEEVAEVKLNKPIKMRAGDDMSSEEVRVLRRIEDRLAESSRLQERGLSHEIDDFQKQRGDMLRTLAENAEATVAFKGELQRVGRQLGTVMGMMEKSNNDMSEQVRDFKLLSRDDATETHRLLMMLVELQVQANKKS